MNDMNDTVQELLEQYGPIFQEHVSGNKDFLLHAESLGRRAGQAGLDISDLAMVCKAALDTSSASTEEKAKSAKVLDFFAESVAAWVIHRSDIDSTPTISPAPVDVVDEVNIAQVRQELAILQEIGLAITSSLDLKTVLQLIAKQMGQAIDATSAYICSHEPEAMTITVLAEYIGPEASQIEKESPSDVGLSYDVRQEFPDVVEFLQAGHYRILQGDDSNLSEANRAHMQEFGARTVLEIPLKIGGQAIAYVSLWESRSRREFTPAEITLCQNIARPAAIAVQNAHLYEQAQQEINERKEAQEQLQKSEKKFRAIFQETLDGIVVIEGMDGTILSSNRSAQRILGYDNGALKGQHFSTLIPMPEMQEQSDFLEKLRAYGGVFEAQDFVRADGSHCPIDLSATIIPWDKNNAVLATLRDVSDRRQAEAEIKQRNRELLALQYTGAVMASNLDLQHLVDTVTQEMVKLLDVEGCVILTWNEAAPEVYPVSAHGSAQWRQNRVSAYPLYLSEHPLLSRVLLDGETHQATQSQAAPDSVELAYMKQFNIQTLLILPMEFQERVIGLIEVNETQIERTFTIDEFRLAQLLTNQAAAAIQSNHLRTELNRYNEQLIVLHQLDRAISNSLQLEDVYEAIVQYTPHLLAYHRMSITLQEEDAIQVYFLYPKNQSPFDPTGAVSSENTMVGWVISHGQPLLRKNLAEDLDSFSEAKKLVEIEMQAAMVVPLWVENKVIGTWNIASRKLGAYGEYDLNIAQSIADQLVIAIQHARLYQRAQLEITERKRIEENLRDERNFASAVLHTANALVVVIDLQGQIIRFNRACEQITGYTFDEVKGKSFWDIFLIPEEVGRVKAILREVWREGALNTNENYWLTKEGQTRLISWSNSALFDMNGEVEYIVCAGIDITMRREAEENLRSSENLFRQVVSSISDHIYVTEVSADGRRLNRYISPNIEDLTGYPFERLMDSWNFWPSVMIHPEDRVIAQEQAERLASGQSSAAEYRLTRVDGRVIWVRDSGRVQEEGGSRVTYGVVGDITERKQRERELEAIAAIATSLRAALNHQEMLPLILEPILDLLQVESAALDIYDPTTGETVVDLAFGVWKNNIGVRTPAGQGISGHVIATGEVYISNDVKNDRRLVKPQTVGHLSAVACVPLVAETQTIGVIWVGRQNDIPAEIVRLLTAISDIAANALYRATLFERLQDSNAELIRLTADLENLVKERTADLEQAVAEASEARDRIDAILHSVADGLIVTDLENKVILVNPAAEEILGFKLESMLGQEIGTGIKDDRLRQIVRGTLNQYINGYEIDIALEGDSDSGQKIMRAHTSLVDDRLGQPLGTVTLIQDVTAIRAVDRMKTEFITTAAHEFRTPLTSIQGFSEILLTRDLEPERQLRFLTMINQQASHLAEIVEDLLDVARLESGRGLEIRPETVDIAGLINEVLLPFMETETEHRIRIKNLDQLPPISGDPFRLAQVSKNLISNAIKYSPEGGTVTISGRMLPGFVEIHIQDEGIGMTPDQQKHLFEKFYRADSSNTSISGTGLGLTICKLIVELHGGKIWVESEYQQGSTIYFTLPQVDKA